MILRGYVALVRRLIRWWSSVLIITTPVISLAILILHRACPSQLLVSLSTFKTTSTSILRRYITTHDKVVTSMPLALLTITLPVLRRTLLLEVVDLRLSWITIILTTHESWWLGEEFVRRLLVVHYLSSIIALI